MLGLDHLLAIVILEVAAVAMVWLALRTDWRTRPKRTPKRRRPAQLRLTPPSAHRRTADDRPHPATPPDPAGGARRSPLARKLGAAAGQARDDGPRQLGRLVGRAQRAAKAAMARPNPAPQRPIPTRAPEAAPETRRAARRASGSATPARAEPLLGPQGPVGLVWTAGWPGP